MAIETITDLLEAKRLVIKVGSSLLVDDQGAKHAWLANLVSDIDFLTARGSQVIVVSSGAIAQGAYRLDLPARGRASLADAQAAAAVGQVELWQLWAERLTASGLVPAQMLVTLGDLEDRRRYLNVAATLERLLELRAVPVVNENDSVATEEIRFGDNDRLAARVAQAANADAVLLLSDVAGLYDRDPSEEGSQLIERVEGVTPEIMAMAGTGSSSGLGSGGMLSKLQAARIAERAGIALAIIDGRISAPITDQFANEKGTLFLPVRADNARKSWLGGRLAPEGALTVDAGCAKALQGGASLLAAGLSGVEGEFQRGALVSVIGPDGQLLGQGLVEYSARECRTIQGLKHREQGAQLGYAPRAAVVHTDQLVRG